MFAGSEVDYVENQGDLSHADDLFSIISDQNK